MDRDRIVRTESRMGVGTEPAHSSLFSVGQTLEVGASASGGDITHQHRIYEVSPFQTRLSCKHENPLSIQADECVVKKRVSCSPRLCRLMDNASIGDAERDLTARSINPEKVTLLLLCLLCKRRLGDFLNGSLW